MKKKWKRKNFLHLIIDWNLIRTQFFYFMEIMCNKKVTTGNDSTNTSGKNTKFFLLVTALCVWLILKETNKILFGKKKRIKKNPVSVIACIHLFHEAVHCFHKKVFTLPRVIVRWFWTLIFIVIFLSTGIFMKVLKILKMKIPFLKCFVTNFSVDIIPNFINLFFPHSGPKYIYWKETSSFNMFWNES